METTVKPTDADVAAADGVDGAPPVAKVAVQQSSIAKDKRTNRVNAKRSSSQVTFESSGVSRARGASSEEDSVAEMDYLSETSNSSQVLSQIPAVDPFPKFNSNTLETLLPRPLASPALANVAAIVADNPTAVHETIIATRKHRSPSIDEPRAPDSVGTQLLVNDDKIQPYECSLKDLGEDHRPVELPRFEDVQTCMWTASHAANCPSEDRSASLVNLLLQPLPPNFDSETQLPTLKPDYKTLIRLNLWAVVDGHGGGCVATYVSEVLLPHIAASVSRALGCAIVDRGVCTVNGQRRNANALDLDGLIQMTAERSPGNPNSIHYRSPYERSDSEEDARGRDRTNALLAGAGDDETALLTTAGDTEQDLRLVSAETSFPDTILDQQGETRSVAEEQASSVKTSVKTAASPATREDLVGTHSPPEVANITRAITESFLAVDEGWINSIDPVATHQTSCHSNGRWNSGACALVVFTIQRLDWTSVSEPGREKEQRDPEKSRLNTCQNRDAARRRMLDSASRAKATSSMSIGSSTSSLTTEEAAHASGIESEITETEGEDDRSLTMESRKKETGKTAFRNPNIKKPSIISPPGGCSCHCYRAHDAIIYTAHVGDCRAVMLGSAPPRTIKVGGGTRGDAEVTDDESSHHSSDETECLSSSDHEADSSEDEDLEGAAVKPASGAPSSEFINLPPRRVTRDKSAKRRAIDDAAGPYIALPPLDEDEDAVVDSFGLETEIERRERRRIAGKDTGTSDSSTTSQESLDVRPLLLLSPGTRPIDLTTDHSAYNPAEVTAVLRRCNNAPRAISAGMGGGIKRVAGSLAVTRALGDAYLKTPKLSFLPYKSHAPYITGRPEVNCRLLVKEGDKVLILATDGVWERASGEDTLRWVRNFYEERRADAERRSKRASQVERGLSPNEDSGDGAAPVGKPVHPEGSERDLFEKSETEKPESDPFNAKKRDASSPLAPNAKRRKRSRQNRISYNVADVIVRRVLNKVRRARNISSLQALMSLPQGRARRSKHDDITASVVDLSAFVS